MGNSNYYCIIMAGGMGRRFWPYSRKSLPKQFIDFFGSGQTLLQQTYERYRRIIPPENIFITTHCSYKELVMEQLPEIREEQLVIEEEQRNTAPAIAYASHIIQKINPNACTVVAPSDHLILKTENFERAILHGLEFASKSDKLITIGIKPTRPETGYGYIQAAEQINGTEIYKVGAFKEKPDVETAKEYVAHGSYFWNAGIFVWNVDTITDAIRKFTPDLAAIMDEMNRDFYTAQEAGTVERLFPTCEKISIDYAVMEKAESIYTLPAEFGWSDLGSWGSLRTLLPQDEHGNAGVGNDISLHNCHNCIVHTAGEKQVVVEGLDGYIIAERNGALLVCSLKEEQNIKRFTLKH